MAHAAGSTEVLIVGAGPTGLVLALWLARRGVRLRIIDTTAEPGTTSRALAMQARTLEFYRQLGLADAVVQQGRRVKAGNFWISGRRVAHVALGGDLGDLGTGESPFPYALVYPQDEHERLLVEHLAAAGVQVERRTGLIAFEATDSGITARLKLPEGTESVCAANYLAGCDGAHSTVREGLGIGFPGGTYEHLFYVADIEGGGPVINGELHVGLDRNDFLAVFPLHADGHARLVGTLRADALAAGAQPGWDDVSKKVAAWMRIEVARVHWFSTYHVHHRVAAGFRQGPVFLLGDAAHIHSPVGGQGMNTGIGDAVNLAWKLAQALRPGAAPALLAPALLDSYEPERIAFARRLVATTDRAFSAVTSDSLLARAVRLRLAPWILPKLFGFAAVRRLLFRTVSQTRIRYRHSPLSAGRAGAIHGGDRLPWVAPTTAGGADNFTPLTALQWQAHVYGEADPALRELCRQRALALHVFPWSAACNHAGLKRDAVYVIRPDGYVAWAGSAAQAAGGSGVGPAISGA